MSRDHYRGHELRPEDSLAIIIVLVAFAISPFAALASIPLVFLKRRYLVEFLAGTAVAVVVTFVLSRPALAHVHDAFAHMRHVRLSEHPRRALVAAWPSMRAAWLLMLPTAPVMALVFDLVRGKSVEAKAHAEERRRQRSRNWRRRVARRRARTITASTAWDDAVSGSGSHQAVILGAKVDGERVGYEDRRGRVGIPADALLRHTLVVGASGSGKTETLFRIAYGASAAGYRVYYFDAKADDRAMQRFLALMSAGDVDATAVFPDCGYDGFRGDARAVYNRLIELVRFSDEGDGAYYRDVAKRLLWAVCSVDAGPPRTSAELLARLAPAELRRLAPGVVDDLGQREVAGVRLRYEAFFAALGDRLDGGHAFENVLAGYVMLDGLSLKEETGSLARFMLEDFAHFAKHRKRPGDRVLLILDEFSAIADSADVVGLVERLRSHDVGVVLAPQAEEGLAEDELARARIVQSCETVVLHATKRPESLAALAGTRLEVQSSLQHEDGRATGMGSGRSQHVFKVDPNDVRQLGRGECFVIREGRAAQVQIARAPKPQVILPLEEPLPSAATTFRRKLVLPPMSDDLRL